MEAKIIFMFLDPFKHSDVIKIKLKWKRLSHYTEENKNKNFAKFFDEVRFAMQGALNEMKSNGVKGAVGWSYNGFLPDFMYQKLKESDGVYRLKMDGANVRWAMWVT